MAKVRVAIAGTVGKSVLIDDTVPSRVSALESALRSLQTTTTTGASRRHSSLAGLQDGNDHPQYPLKRALEDIPGQWSFSRPLWLSDGTAALPALTRESDPNTGVYWLGADNLGLSTGGVARWDVNTTRVHSTLPHLGPNGSILAPTWSFSSDADTGRYWVSADLMAETVGGIQRATWSTTALQLVQDNYELQLGAGTDLRLYH